MFTQLQAPAAAGFFKGSPSAPADPERARTCSMWLQAVRKHGHVVGGRQHVVTHRVVPEGDGVAVTLTHLSAEHRAPSARLQIDSLMASLRLQVR